MSDQERNRPRGGRVVQTDAISMRITEYGKSSVIEVRGELDLATVGTLEGEIGRVDGGRPVRLDLGHLAFMDSAGINLLRRNKSVGVGRASSRVEWLIRLCDLGNRLPGLSPPLG